MPSCCAINCTQRPGAKSKKSFHRFPHSRPDLLKRWLQEMRRDKWNPGPRSLLCSDHFVKECFDLTGQTVRIRTEAIPTKFNFLKSLRKTRSPKSQKLAVPRVDSKRTKQLSDSKIKKTPAETSGTFTRVQKPKLSRTRKRITPITPPLLSTAEKPRISPTVSINVAAPPLSSDIKKSQISPVHPINVAALSLSSDIKKSLISPVRPINVAGPLTSLAVKKAQISPVCPINVVPPLTSSTVKEAQISLASASPAIVSALKQQLLFPAPRVVNCSDSSAANRTAVFSVVRKEDFPEKINTASVQKPPIPHPDVLLRMLKLQPNVVYNMNAISTETFCNKSGNSRLPVTRIEVKLSSMKPIQQHDSTNFVSILKCPVRKEPVCNVSVLNGALRNQTVNSDAIVPVVKTLPSAVIKEELLESNGQICIKKENHLNGGDLKQAQMPEDVLIVEPSVEMLFECEEEDVPGIKIEPPDTREDNPIHIKRQPAECNLDGTHIKIEPPDCKDSEDAQADTRGTSLNTRKRKLSNRTNVVESGIQLCSKKPRRRKGKGRKRRR